MANLLELKKEFNMIPEYQIKNLTECTTDELLFELGYCDWLIKQEHDLEYAYQLKTLIVNNLLKIKINYVQKFDFSIRRQHYTL